MDTMITIDDFFKVKVQVGKVVEATHPDVSEKLIRLRVDIGEGELRTIFTGVRPFGFVADDFLGKQFLFVTNLQPKRMIGEESQGMILAVDGPDGKPIFVEAANMPIGSTVR